MNRDLISTLIDYDGSPYRNIKAVRESRSLFDDLAEDEADISAASLADALGKPYSPAPLLTRPFDYGIVITYPFLEKNRQQTRFSDDTLFGVWYGSEEIETTVYETVFHWRNFLLDAFPSENRVIRGDRRIFKVQCRGIVIDLRGKEQTWPALVDRYSYKFTQDLGHYLQDQNQNGLLVASARCRGINLAAFTPRILSGPMDICSLTYLTNLSQGPEVMVEKEPGKTWITIDGNMLV
jgi:hypothetical protein